ncbi:TPA: RDD family protein [Candidatus Woesearchaeota archaeon]|nr:RDD family protein [Candidatus Woesearchaeota archaeon]HIJ18251.1 RDD family protein [Candidatus Woesearchaeota archaeon]
MPRGKKKMSAGQEGTEVPALLWKRAAAFVIDAAIVYAILFLAIGGKLATALPDAASFAESYALMAESSILNWVSVIFSLMLLLYFLLLERRFGQSIGKMAMGLHVQSDSGHISFWQHLGRAMFLIPVFPFMVLWIADPIAMLFTRNNRRLSEIVSKTRVVEYRELPAAPDAPMTDSKEKGK